MILIEIIGVGDPDGCYNVDNGVEPFRADAEHTVYDEDGWSNVRKMQFLFNQEISGLDDKLHKFVSFWQIVAFQQYEEVIVRYKRKKNA